MSASKKRQARQEENQEVLAEREQKRQEAAKAEHRSKVTYVIVGAVVALFAVLAIVWNTGAIQRSMTAVTINGTKYNAAAVQYHLTTIMSQYGYTSGSTSSLKSVVMDEENGITMFDFFLEQAIDNMIAFTALADQAKEEGYTMSQSTQESLDASLASLDDTAASLGYADGDAFLRAKFGPYMDYDQFVALLNQDMLVQDYISNSIYAIEYSDGEYEDYYKENKDSLDSYTLSQFVFQARVDTTDDAGNTIEMTDEEKTAALDEAKAGQKALAEELMAKLEAGEDAAALAKEYAANLYSSQISVASMGSLVNTSYSEWAFDSTRKDGDVTMAEYDSTTAYNYYVVRFEGRQRDDSPTNDIRHILVSDEAKAKEILALWESGEQTAETFANLAMQYSEDTNSAVNGGLIPNVTPDSSYVEPFLSWSIDSARKDGDVDLVQTSYGWHIMHYTAGDPAWKETVDTTLRNLDYTEWVQAAREGYTATQGTGVKFVQG